MNLGFRVLLKASKTHGQKKLGIKPSAPVRVDSDLFIGSPGCFPNSIDLNFEKLQFKLNKRKFAKKKKKKKRKLCDS